MLRKLFILIILIAVPYTGTAKLPDLGPKMVNTKMNEIMKAHAKYKKLTPELIKRILVNYLEELDPSKSYFIASDIQDWTEPLDATLNRILAQYNNSDFAAFQQIHDVMITAIHRRVELEKKINMADLPTNVAVDEFKDMKWANNEQELLTRITRIKALQVESSAKLSPEVKDTAMKRIAKRQTKYEESFLTEDPVQREHLILSNVLKASASALDAHTAYFTPDEAQQFMINVQQRLFGIGAQLRDDISGFTVIKVIEGGPAAEGKKLKANDRIIAVNGEPVVGMDIIDAVDLIRGEEHTPVTLTVIRMVDDKEEKLDIVINRGEVVLKESRYEVSYEPFGNGVIAYLRLHAFYQDPESSSASDLEKAFELLQSEHKIEGVVLDLRFNSGGLLSQAVAVTGLFITKGTVVSIKDDAGNIQHLRNLDEKVMWGGPLIVLINRASASASEIVAQALQDYGRSLTVGDDHSYGKGTFQTFTLNTNTNAVNPQGEYKVTRGVYYTVSGKTPQQTGILSDIIIPGSLIETDIGEKSSKYPLANERIKPNFDDDLIDIPYMQREKIKALYKFNLQKKEDLYGKYLPVLKKNTAYRIEHNKNYQDFLAELKKKGVSLAATEDDSEQEFGKIDLQLNETYSVMKDLVFMIHTNPK